MSHIDLEQGTHRRDGSDISSGEASVCFSEADEGSCYSQFYSTAGGSYDDYSFAEGEIDGGASDSRRVSDCSVEAETEGGVAEIKVHLAKVEKVCRICHLGLESNSHESGVSIELGCSCKDDLAAAHKLCAEAWFKIRGNKTCEICHSIARNVVGVNEGTDQSNDTNSSTTTATVPGPAAHTDTPSFWHGHRILNFLLACMVFAFVISWLFHFNMPSS
ncbi:hypothetical protein ERO13_A04G086300v2 [Gossypium hirsutum]|uniref:RING-CH-type domain-containing protein n=4 Tax=Gossypium TaxID=3633 RepID=A0A2P5YTR8_GOSBA|nr:uncharacterized protein LOC107948846 [Gossypium hirsutum]KAB2087462.1 hypothetical protein ES319_A04G106100v1 [Gossypium barbadense]TYH22330.1 hypothetical protein ES288_A04G119600v1 [Gossypium darwinii]TYI33247.1 hypothetical protein ES332_A04G119800v1 [Gossypium tomentosum]KAG4205152.1 hypothetical protein ERO13_A04G086300v2 [Gossypium hirsutum]PPS18987.1 hypothetical protein GOBAR_AA01579 [Gossypium barbadense]